jgi:predicted membrane protein
MENSNKKNKNKGKVVVGLALLLVGFALLFKQFGFYYPNWLISWPMLLIVFGIANGFKHGFRNSGWLIMLLIGGVFLAEKIDPELSVTRYTWPVILIGLGAWCIFGKQNFKDSEKFCRERSKWKRDDFYMGSEDVSPEELEEEKKEPAKKRSRAYTGDEVIDSVSVFGGTTKTVLSKSFKGGEIVTIMGGTVLNLTHADIDGVAIIEVVQVFGGTKIIIPQNWEVNTEMAAIFGGIDDKRMFQNQALQDGKTLVIKGTSIFGGIEIKSF